MYEHEAALSTAPWDNQHQCRRHSAGYYFLPDCERVRVSGGAAPRVLQGRPREREANDLFSPREGDWCLTRPETRKRTGRARAIRSRATVANGAVARLVGINHVALEVGDLDEALAWYGSLFEFELRGRHDTRMAFIDLGDQFIAISSGRAQPPDGSRHLGLVVDDKEAVRERVRKQGIAVQSSGSLDFLDPWGNHIQVVDYHDIQFTKAPEVLRGMKLEGLSKSEQALAELRAERAGTRGAPREGPRQGLTLDARIRKRALAMGVRGPTHRSRPKHASRFRPTTCLLLARSRSNRLSAQLSMSASAKRG